MNVTVERVIRAVNSVYHNCGLRLSTRTRTNRLRLQKVVFLLRALGYAPASRFEFKIHMNGPYSMELASGIAQLSDEEISRAGASDDLPKATLRIISESLQRGPAFLEALATVIDGTPRLGSVQASIGWARQIKPLIDGQVWTEVEAFLERERTLTKYT